jgi:hypothetical protein
MECVVRRMFCVRVVSCVCVFMCCACVRACVRVCLTNASSRIRMGSLDRAVARLWRHTLPPSLLHPSCTALCPPQEFLDVFTQPAKGPDPTGRNPKERMVPFRVSLHLTEVPASVAVSVPAGAGVGTLRQAVADAGGVVADEINLYLYSVGDKAAAGTPPGVLLDNDSRCVEGNTVC